MKFLAEAVKYSIFFFAISFLNCLQLLSYWSRSVLRLVLLPLSCTDISPRTLGLLSLFNIILGLSPLIILGKSLSHSLLLPLLLLKVAAKSAALLLLDFNSAPDYIFWVPSLSIEFPRGLVLALRASLLRRGFSHFENKWTNKNDVFALTSWKVSWILRLRT